MKNILIVVAHPDDAELGMGASIKKMTESGLNVYYLQMTYGFYYDLDQNPIRSMTEIRETNKLSLEKELGIKNENIIVEWNNETTNLQFNRDNISAIQRRIQYMKIDTIFTHPPKDTYHQDHIATHNNVMAAARRYVNNIFFFENIFSYADGLIQPTLYIPIQEKHLISKEFSLMHHKSEFEKFGGDKWLKQIRAMSIYRGAQIGTDYAEAFVCQKQILDW
jgi:LmbE family N-acetylglucosaminyl deacetylase